MNWPWLELQIVHLPVGGDRDDAGMRLDIGLVHRLAGIAALDRDLGFLPALREIALHEGDALGDVRRRARLRIDALRIEVVVQDRRVRPHRVLDVDDVRQYLVLDLDQVERLLGDPRLGRRHRRDGVAFIEHLVARHAVARQVAEIHRPLADKGFLGRDFRKIRRGDDRLDARQGQRLLRIDRLDPGMRVRAALDLGPDHAGHRHVGAEIGAPDDLFDPVRTHRPGADDFQRSLIEIRHALISMNSISLSRNAGEGAERKRRRVERRGDAIRRPSRRSRALGSRPLPQCGRARIARRAAPQARCSPRITSAASSTARTILS